MCDECDDINRTVLMLSDMALYAYDPGADPVFVAVVGEALAASLPPDVRPHGPAEGPGYFGQGPWQ